MNAIDRTKLLAWLERNGDPTDDITEWQDGFTTCCKTLIELIKSGAFDIKPHEGRTGQAIRVPGEIEWEDETHD